MKWDINGVALDPLRFVKKQDESHLHQTDEIVHMQAGYLWWLHGAAAAPGGPYIDHLYVGHLAQSRPELPVTIDVSNQLWCDMIGCGAESRDLVGEEAEWHYPARSLQNV